MTTHPAALYRAAYRRAARSWMAAGATREVAAVMVKWSGLVRVGLRHVLAFWAVALGLAVPVGIVSTPSSGRRAVAQQARRRASDQVSRPVRGPDGRGVLCLDRPAGSVVSTIT